MTANKKNALTVIALLVISLLQAQEKKALLEKVKPHFYYLFIEPFAVLQPYSSTARFGIEVPIYKRMSATASYGINLTEGYSIKAELKRYFLTDRSDARYLSVEGFYKTEAYTVHDNIRVFENGIPTPTTPVSYYVSKQVNGLRAKFGEVDKWGKRFILDYYGGIGIRKRMVDADITQAKQDSLYHYHESMINGASNKTFHGYTVDFTLGLKIGWIYAR